MLNILSVTGPIYIVIFLGWATTRTGLFSRARPDGENYFPDGSTFSALVR